MTDRLSIIDSYVDKRPVLFPFLVSVVHDLTGYRPSNAILLNGVFGFLFLVGIYIWGYRIGGQRVGILSVLLMTSLPLLAQNVSGGGFDILNALLILALLLSGWRYLESSGSNGLDLMVATGLLLANTRYESLLYLLVVAGLALIKWSREKRISITWFSALSPLFLISPLLTNKVFLNTDSFFESGKEAYMGLKYLVPNLERVVYYLIAPPSDGLGNSLLLTLIGGIALLSLCVVMVTRIGGFGKWPLYVQSFAPIVIIVGLATFITQLSFWGQWDDPMATRFSLPAQMVMVLSVAPAMCWCGNRLQPPAWINIAFAGWVFLVTVPQLAKHLMTTKLPTFTESRFFISWMNDNLGNEDFVIAPSATGPILYGHPSLSFNNIRGQENELRTSIEAGSYKAAYVFDEVVRTSEGIVDKDESSKVPEWLASEPIASYKLRPNVTSRISKVIGTYGPDGEVIPFGHIEPPKFDDTEELIRWYYKSLP